MMPESSVLARAGHRPSVGMRRARLLYSAWGIWLAAFVTLVYVLLTHVIHPLPYGVYADAGRHWLQRKPLYDLRNIDGFQYFPPAALVFAPFTWLGSPLGGVAWRGVNWLALGFGMWRMARLLQPTAAEACFSLTTGLAVVSATGSLGNGQANLTLAALTLQVAADLAEERFWPASALLAFGIGLKPLMAVYFLLAWPL